VLSGTRAQAGKVEGQRENGVCDGVDALDRLTPSDSAPFLDEIV
jgi:hypothetical protein